jgi:hypothetical protein
MQNMLVHFCFHQPHFLRLRHSYKVSVKIIELKISASKWKILVCIYKNANLIEFHKLFTQFGLT